MRVMISVANAQAHILAQVTRIAPPEVAAVGACLGRVLAEDVRATFDVPPTDNSAVDGYAVRSEDVPSDGQPRARRWWPSWPRARSSTARSDPARRSAS